MLGDTIAVNQYRYPPVSGFISLGGSQRSRQTFFDMSNVYAEIEVSIPSISLT